MVPCNCFRDMDYAVWFSIRGASGPGGRRERCLPGVLKNPDREFPGKQAWLRERAGGCGVQGWSGPQYIDWRIVNFPVRMAISVSWTGSCQPDLAAALDPVGSPSKP